MHERNSFVKESKNLADRAENNCVRSENNFC